MAGREGHSVKKAEEGLRVATDISPTPATIHPSTPLDPLPDRTDNLMSAGVAVCEYTNGICSVHGEAEQLWRPSKTWRRKKDGTFGWKYVKETYYSCRKITRKPAVDPQPTFIAGGEQSEPLTQKNFTVLTTGGRRGRRGYMSKNLMNTADRK